MNNRLRVLLILFGTLLVLATYTFPFWRPLIERQTITESFPGLPANLQSAFGGLPTEQQGLYRQMLKANPTMAVEMAKAALSPDRIVPDVEQAMPQMGGSSIVAKGEFTQIDAVHKAEGTATLYQLPDNSRILRFEKFKATNGPDLHVLLTRNPEPRAPADVGNDFVDLGQLKGNVGDQNYRVPSELDLSQYQGVVIYSLVFGAIFSSAKLTS
jgi:hypothetical protein